MTAELSPTIREFQTSHPGVLSRRHFSSSHTTAAGAFSFLSGLHPYLLDFMSEARRPLPSFRILRANGYRLYGTSASLLGDSSPGMPAVLDQLDDYREFSHLDPMEKDQAAIRWMKEKYQAHDPDCPFFFFIFLNAPHHNYTSPPEFQRFQPTLPDDYDHFLGDGKLRSFREEIFNRYKNSILYTDHLFGRLIKIFQRELKDGNLVVALTGDHGEEFWDAGLLGHSKPRFIRSRIETPLVLHLPGVKALEINLSCHADLFPTVIDYLDPVNDFLATDFFHGVSLMEDEDPRRVVSVFSQNFPLNNKTFAFVSGNQKYVMSSESDRLDQIDSTELINAVNLEDKPKQADPIERARLLKRFHEESGWFLVRKTSVR